MFPSSGSVARHPLPSTGSRRGRFPGFGGTMGCSESLRTVTTGLRVVRPPLPRGRACLRVSAQARRRPGARGVGVRPPPGRFSGGVAGRPKFLGNPGVPRPCSRTPAGPEPPGHEVVRRGPRHAKTEGYPRVSQSRGSIAGRGHSLSTLRGVGCPAATQDSLPAAGQALPGGIGYPQGSYERFP
jgi:hypothetical protein